MKSSNKKVLVACEESQAVTIELRKLGIQAYSCDIEPCSGGHPEWHIQGDVTPLLKKDWAMIIAFPPCTYLSNVSNRHYSSRINTLEKISARKKLREEAAMFFMSFWETTCHYVAIENPVGYMNTIFRKPDQIIHPYFFGEPFQKRTCLWLKNLPLLTPTNMLPKPEPLAISKGKLTSGKRINWVEGVCAKNSKEKSRVRSKTFSGVAKAMAMQWGTIILQKEIENADDKDSDSGK